MGTIHASLYSRHPDLTLSAKGSGRQKGCSSTWWSSLPEQENKRAPKHGQNRDTLADILGRSTYPGLGLQVLTHSHMSPHSHQATAASIQRRSSWSGGRSPNSPTSFMEEWRGMSEMPGTTANIILHSKRVLMSVSSRTACGNCRGVKGSVALESMAQCFAPIEFASPNQINRTTQHERTAGDTNQKKEKKKKQSKVSHWQPVP